MVKNRAFLWFNAVITRIFCIQSVVAVWSTRTHLGPNTHQMCFEFKCGHCLCEENLFIYIYRVYRSLFSGTNLTTIFLLWKVSNPYILETITCKDAMFLLLKRLKKCASHKYIQQVTLPRQQKKPSKLIRCYLYSQIQQWLFLF